MENSLLLTSLWFFNLYAGKWTCSWSSRIWTLGVRHRHQPLSTHCESTPGSVSMPAWAPAERVSHILQLGLCHHWAPGPTCKPRETKCIFNAEEYFSQSSSSGSVRLHDDGRPVHFHLLWLSCTYLGSIVAFCTGRFTRQAVPQLLDSVQSHTGLKDSHRYPTLTRCHCRDPMITISAPHETFMACWQSWSGKHPNV